MGVYPQQRNLIVSLPTLVTFVLADLLKVLVTDNLTAVYDIRLVQFGIGDHQVLNALQVLNVLPPTLF